MTSSEAVLSALPSPLLAEAQMLRDRAMSHYQARSLFGNSHRLNNRRNGLGFDRQTVIDRGVGVTIGQRTSSALLESLKVKEVEGDPLLDPDALKSLIRLLRLAQVITKILTTEFLFTCYKLFDHFHVLLTAPWECCPKSFLDRFVCESNMICKR